MSKPVIRGVTVDPRTVAPGGQATVTIDAFDPDSRTVTCSAEVTDSAGNTATATTNLTVGDPLTYSLTTDDPGIESITQDPQQPNLFHVAV